MSTSPGESMVRIAAKTQEAVDICGFELVAADARSLPAFSAGSHIDVTVGGLTRQYSLCNDPSEKHRYLIAVLKDAKGRGGSLSMHEQLHPGDTIQISVPRNHFHLASNARRHLLLAGGIGVTPILCMADRLAGLSADFSMHCCARSPERAAFRTRVEQSGFASRVHFHFDDGTQEQKLDIPALLRTPEPAVHVYVCGPKGFMDAVLCSARESGAGPKSNCTTSSSPRTRQPRGRTTAASASRLPARAG